MASLEPSEMTHMPNNDTLIRMWAKTLTMSSTLNWCATWPRFVPDKGYPDKAAEWRAKLEENGQ